MAKDKTPKPYDDVANRNLTKKQATLILQTYNQKMGQQTLLEEDFPQQTNFIRDPAKLKAALCTRRAGKSHGIGLYLFLEALSAPDLTCVYIGLTHQTAKKIMWRLMNQINKQHSLGAIFKETDLSIHLPNGSVIYMMGMNTTSDEQEKILGGGYKLVCIDECASFTQDLRQIVYGAIAPAMADQDGTICLIGTPGNLIQMRHSGPKFGAGFAKGEKGDNVEMQDERLSVEKPLFYAVTTGEEPGWSVHKWSTDQNPFMAKNWQKSIDAMVNRNPYVKDTPIFRQHYLGEWYVDTDKLVYKFDNNRNTIDMLPILPNGEEYTYLLGIDLGWTDPSAFVVAAYSKHDNKLYYVYFFKKSKMLLSQVEKKIKEICAIYPISRYIIDSKAKQSVEDIKARTGFPLIAAEQVGKIEKIHMMNSDLIGGNILCLPAMAGLVEEWGSLIWDERNGTLLENKACQNHGTDAALYCWRYAYNYLAVQPAEVIQKNTDAWMDQWWDKQADKIKNKNKGRNRAEDDWKRYGL